MQISLCMIVKNEEDTLRRCLESVKELVDEIIIVDTGSTDRTKQIAAEFTDKVYDFEWINDFSAARNYAFSKASKDFAMWLDADDVIPDYSRQLFLNLKKSFNNQFDVIYLPYHIAFDNKGKATYRYYRERIVRMSLNPVWVEPVHEYIKLESNKKYTWETPIEHRKIKAGSSKRNLEILSNHIKSGCEVSPRMTYYYARELMDHSEYKDAVHYFEKFLNDGKGWIEDNIQACLSLSYAYNRLGDKQNEQMSALRALSYATDRGEIFCRLGDIALSKNELNSARFWYETAANTPLPKNSLGFVQTDYYDYIPYMQLCVVYYRLGDMEKSRYYNEKAGNIKPDDSAYLFNRRLFDIK
jgi:glycosyltransferase involved in cell wall biosynthesis